MNIIQAIILGIIQGLTEFVPISSSGHLVIAHRLMGVQTGGLAFDVALHVGTLVALLLFFYKDIIRLIKGLFVKDEYGRTSWLLILATIPAVIAGVVFGGFAETSLRSIRVVAVSLIVVAIFMFIAEKKTQNLKRHNSIHTLSPKQAIAMGLAQAVAIIPGVSRSGSTITAGLFLGLDRVSSTRFSFLLAIPITFGAIIKIASEPGTINYIGTLQSVFVYGILSSIISGIIAIRFLIRFLSRHSLGTFAYYRIALGVVLLILSMYL